MLVSLRWLETYVEIPWDAHALAARLTQAGAKVEGVHTLEHDYAGVVVGKIAAVRQHPGADALKVCQVDLGDRTVSIRHPGRGHTDHDLIAVIIGSDRPVVFCGDLVEESGDASVDADSDPVAWPVTLDRVIDAGGADAVFLPGHGAVVDAAFIRRQQGWLRTQM